MPVATLVEYFATVQELIDRWTPEALLGLPGYPDRPDAKIRSKTAWYRGHSELRWQLLPAVYRMTGYTLRREIDMNLSYLRKVSFLPNLPPIADLGAWLSFMQHHHLPTRLLDWSESPTVALYFAIEEYRQYHSWERVDRFRPNVWIVNPFALNWVASEHASSLVTSTSPNEQSGSGPGDYSRAFGCRNILPAFGAGAEGPFAGPMAVEPHALDPRMHAQRARFTVHGIDQRPIEAMFRDREAEDLEHLGFLANIDVVPDAAESLLLELAKIGVSASILFPDPDGVSKETEFAF